MTMHLSWTGYFLAVSAAVAIYYVYMKSKVIMIVVLMGLLKPGYSQKVKEWFEQKKTQKEYLIGQIAQLRIYMELTIKGYKIAKKRLIAFKDIKTMNVASYLDRFFKDISVDARVTMTHISVYAAILQCLHKARTNSLSMFGFELMQVAKISSGKTYYKTVRELHEFGHICYEPSFKKNQPSRISLPSKV
jgi:hypothetical protein